MIISVDELLTQKGYLVKEFLKVVCVVCVCVCVCVSSLVMSDSLTVTFIGNLKRTETTLSSRSVV